MSLTFKLQLAGGDVRQAGCSNILQLHREIAELGYLGSRSLMYRALVPWRGPRPPPEADVGSRRRGGRPRRPKRFSLRWLCLRPPHQLDHEEQKALQLALQEDERLAAGYRLLQRFRRLIPRRGIHDLDAWLDDAIASGLAPLVSLAHGIQADRAAVDAGLSLPWSTGPVEGHVTRPNCSSVKVTDARKLDCSGAESSARRDRDRHRGDQIKVESESPESRKSRRLGQRRRVSPRRIRPDHHHEEF